MHVRKTSDSWLIATFIGLAATCSAQTVSVLDRIAFMPAPHDLAYHGSYVPFPASISVTGINREDPSIEGITDTLSLLFAQMPTVRIETNGEAPYRIQFQISDRISSSEGYELDSTENGIHITGRTPTGLFYGAQTAYQLLAYAYMGTRFLGYSESSAELDAATKRYIPLLSIKDAPAYRQRAFMVDLGRSPYSVALLKRTIQMMAQVKLNSLHIHLYDDQLCGFRFKSLPLGSENPFALTAADLKEVVRYARVYHISVMPELESWGHVGSLVYHYPELNGGPGQYAGASFAVGEATYALLERIYDEIMPCLEDQASVHVGLDEAKWTTLEGEDENATPGRMVQRIHEILMRVAAKHHKTITMHLWADHGGRPLPPELANSVVVEPWRYLESDGASITEILAKYGGAGKTPIMMGAGANSLAYSGNYEATRLWCQGGLKYPNILGVTLCLWESNDVAGRLITLYAGAGFAWTPNALPRQSNDPLGERMRQSLDRKLRTWQIIYPVANPDEIDRDRGPEAKSGRYLWPPNAGVAVAPTALFVAPEISREAPERASR